MTLYGRAREFARELLRGETEAQERLSQAYKSAYDSATREISQLVRQIERALTNGERVRKSWLFKEDRLERVLSQLDTAGQSFSNQAESITSRAQVSAIAKGDGHAKELIAQGRRMIGAPESFSRANLEATYNLVGTLGDGSPLKATLESASRGAVAEAEKVLTSGVALGKNPRVIGKELQRTVGTPAVRASTIARTEVLRSYRSASFDNYEANDDILEGWVRLEALDSRTCAVCWWAHGREYRLKEEFDGHPNCRGTLMPKLIGVPSGVDLGIARFERQSEKTKIQVLGPRTYEAYLNQGVTLNHLVERYDDPDWGPQLRRRPLREVLGLTVTEGGLRQAA